MKNKKVMKNIHVLRTDKSTGIFETNSGLQYSIMNKVRINPSNGYHIYITSDEQPKHNDYYTIDGKKIYYCNTLNPTRNNHYKKIILTTDQDLIKDGVQSIDDDFLEWFVKNSSCEEVEVNLIQTEPLKGFIYNFEYKIIIPKEELPIVNGSYGCTIQTKMQETIEEFIESTPYYGSCTTEYKEGIEEGAKWQQERMYSEEDIIQAFEDGMNNVNYDDFHVTTKQWFEQFKKK